MSIEAAIHERWRICRQLIDLIPDAKLWTGEVPFEDAAGQKILAPYASIVVAPDMTTTRTSSRNRIAQGTLTLKVWAGTLAAAQNIVDKARDWFNRADFDYSRGRVLDMRSGERTSAEEADNDDSPIWSVAITFDFSILERP